MNTQPIFICSLLPPCGVQSLNLFDDDQRLRIIISSAPDDQDPGSCGFMEAVRVLRTNQVPYKPKKMLGGALAIELSGTKQTIGSDMNKILPTTMWPVLMVCLYGDEGALHFHNAIEPADVQQAREEGRLIDMDGFIRTEPDIMSR